MNVLMNLRRGLLFNGKEPVVLFPIEDFATKWEVKKITGNNGGSNDGSIASDSIYLKAKAHNKTTYGVSTARYTSVVNFKNYKKMIIKYYIESNSGGTYREIHGGYIKSGYNTTGYLKSFGNDVLSDIDSTNYGSASNPRTLIVPTDSFTESALPVVYLKVGTTAISPAATIEVRIISVTLM